MSEEKGSEHRKKVDFLTLNYRIQNRLCIYCGMVKVSCTTCSCEQCKKKDEESHE